MNRRLRLILSLILVLNLAGTTFALDPNATKYSWEQCQGSLRPYPQITQRVAIPDSFDVVHINHVGRHGARFPASPNYTTDLYNLLSRADSLGTITSLGRKLWDLTVKVAETTQGQWGALDSLGMAEQRGIASRMYLLAPERFNKCLVEAISSYSPRCMMSMFQFTHQLDRLNNQMQFNTSTGRINSPLLRPFDTDTEYVQWRKEDKWKAPYQEYFNSMCPTGPIEKVVGKDFPWEDDRQKQEASLTEYYFLANLEAMSLSCNHKEFLTEEEANLLWSIFNLRQYLQRTATTISTIPAEIASALLLNLIDTTQNAVDNHGSAMQQPAANLRFGHAETLMPLLSLMRLKGCYYMTNYFDTVRSHWLDFYVVPMASNLQLILLRHKKKGTFYVRVDLNEVPIPLMPNDESIYLPWSTAKQYLTRCLPQYLQI